VSNNPMVDPYGFFDYFGDLRCSAGPHQLRSLRGHSQTKILLVLSTDLL
jgi:hypothetical protein